jgi:hypothetical protein
LLTFDNLKHGEEMQIERRVYSFDAKDIAALSALSIEELQALRTESTAKETVIFDKLCEDAGAWEAQAAETMLIDRAMEYVKTKAIEHTGNVWKPDGYGHGQEISNMVYKMHHYVHEDTKYDRETKQSVPVAWYLTWAVRTQTVGHYSGAVAGQDRQRFTDKAAMEKYLQGRIKTYSHLFTELSPPVPKEYERYFCVNGQLLPGYRVEGQEQERPSALDRLAAAKEAVAKGSAEKPAAPKSKSKAQEEI